MSHTNFSASNNLAMPGSGLASRRGGQAIKPLSIDAIKPGADKDGSLVTPRTSRSHLLAGLRTAPKSATAATFPQSPTAATAMNQQSRNVSSNGAYSGAETTYSGPKTSLPRFAHGQTYNSAYAQQAVQHQQQQQQAQQQRILQQQQQQLLHQQQQHYTADQILAPPELDDDAALMDAEYAEIVATNMYLAQQQQRLQQQLMSVQAAQQQFQNLNIGGNGQQPQQQQPQQQQNAAYQQLLYQQQQHLAQQQAAQQQQQLYSYIDPVTGQQALYVGQPSQINSQYVEQYNANLQQLQYLQLLQKQQQLQLQQQQTQQQQQLLQEQEQRMPHQQVRGTQMFQQQFQQHHHHMHRQGSPITAPRVQVSPPPSEGANPLRNVSPPRRIDSTTPSSDHAPLPPPSANAFRRGHKKSSSLFNGANLLDANNGALANGQEMPKSAGPKTATFPPNVMQTGTYGPGQARAGEHPIRQPRGPPNFDELASKPTSKHEGSKNFATRTRRSAVHNLVRAGFSRRQVTASGSSGSISPISETAEEQPNRQEQQQEQEQDLATTLTDDESVSGRSGSGSLNGDDVECSLPSSRTSTGSWGAIGSERPGSREKSITRKSVESLNSATTSDNESASGAATPGSFASVFKSVKPTAGGQQRKAPMVLMKNTEKRRFAA